MRIGLVEMKERLCKIKLHIDSFTNPFMCHRAMQCHRAVSSTTWVPCSTPGFR